uniref:Uncharacterized protein n=1 Tax=Opuntia streptacantha TaxID=393608 RepID=A0A7C8YVI4_OPUST
MQPLSFEFKHFPNPLICCRSASSDRLGKIGATDSYFIHHDYCSFVPTYWKGLRQSIKNALSLRCHAHTNPLGLYLRLPNSGFLSSSKRVEVDITVLEIKRIFI